MRGLAAIFVVGCSFSHGYSGAVDSPPDVDTSTDTDGDGVPDVRDNCPTVANADQHDWDHDGHGDACDRCPHLASASDPDGDGDGVGDDCDPQPGVQNQRLYWMGFYDSAEIAAWRNYIGAGTWVVQGDHLDESAAVTNAILDAPVDTGDVYFASRIEVASPLTSGATEIGFCAGDIPPGQQYYCCSINGSGVRAVSQWATPPASPGQLSTPATWAGSIAVGAQIDVTGTMTATQHACTFAQGTTTAAAATTRGPATPGAPCFYTVGDALGRWLYVFVVTVK